MAATFVSGLNIELGQPGSILTPGLSGSFDYNDFDTLKDAMLTSILRKLNNMTIPEISFDGGYLRNNRLYVQQKADSLIFIPVEAENALVFQISNIVADMSVQEFAYTKLLIPIKGFAKIKMQGVFLRVKVKFSRLFTKDNRILP